jgi:CBS domain containing-hemolysin-like protein
MMSWVLVSLVIAIGLLLSAFFSGAETGLYCVNRVRLHLGVQRHEAAAVRLVKVLGDEQGALSLTLIGTNVSNYITTAAVAFLFADLFGCGALNTELYTVVALTPIVFVFGEVVPKSLFQRHADRLMMASSRVLVSANWLLRATGIIWCFRLLTGALHRLAGVYREKRPSFAPKRRIALLLHEALAGKALAVDHSELIDRVCRFSETPLHAVMVPRNEVKVISAEAGRRELLRMARRVRHARLPVFDTRRRHIVGVAKVDELLRTDDWSTVGERLQPALNVSPHDTVAMATAYLQAKGPKIAIVTDRGSQMLGIVTLQDLLEEVVGELAEGF